MARPPKAPEATPPKPETESNAVDPAEWQRYYTYSPSGRRKLVTRKRPKQP